MKVIAVMMLNVTKLRESGNMDFILSVKNHLGSSTRWHRFKNRDWENHLTSIQDATVLARKVCLSGKAGREAAWMSDVALWLLEKRLLLSNPASDTCYLCVWVLGSPGLQKHWQWQYRFLPEAQVWFLCFRSVLDALHWCRRSVAEMSAILHMCRANQDLIHVSNPSWKGAELMCKHMLSCHVVRGFAKAVPPQHGPLLCPEHTSGIKPNEQGRCHTDLDRPRRSTRV